MNPPPPFWPNLYLEIMIWTNSTRGCFYTNVCSWLNRFWEDFLKKNNKFSTILSYSPSNRALCLILTNLNTQYVLSLVEMEQLFWKSLKCIKVYGQFNSHTNKKISALDLHRGDVNWMSCRYSLSTVYQTFLYYSFSHILHNIFDGNIT